MGISEDFALPPSQEYRADWIWREMEPEVERGIESDWIGKWVIKPDESEVDAAWKVVNQLFENHGLMSAKTSTWRSSGQRDSYAICVYTPDYRDIEDVESTGHLLSEAGLETEGYKPDLFTLLGVNSDNFDKLGLGSEYLYQLE